MKDNDEWHIMGYGVGNSDILMVSSEDNCMNCLPVSLFNITDPGLDRKRCGVGLFQARICLLTLPVLPGIHQVV